MRGGAEQDRRYAQAAAAFGPALERLCHAYEADPDRRRDLLQEMHIELWRSFSIYDSRCALRTWVYRIGNNVGAKHVMRQTTQRRSLVALEEVEPLPCADDSPENLAGERQVLERLNSLILRLRPIDRQVMLLYLEDLDGNEIAQVTGLSSGAVAVRIHRAKAALARAFKSGARDVG